MDNFNNIEKIPTHELGKLEGVRERISEIKTELESNPTNSELLKQELEKLQKEEQKLVLEN